jgi:hypothetical protein
MALTLGTRSFESSWDDVIPTINLLETPVDKHKTCISFRQGVGLQQVVTPADVCYMKTLSMAHTELLRYYDTFSK